MVAKTRCVVKVGRQRSKGRRTWLFVPVALLGAVGSLLVAPPASAGDGPYGPTTTEGSGDGTPTCEMDQSSGAPGNTVGGSVTGAPAGDELEVYLGSTLVTEVTVEPAAPGDPTVTSFTFTVPEVEPGQYDVVVVGTAFNATCGYADGSTEFQVVGETVVQGEEVIRPGSDGGSGSGGQLPFTGIDVLPAVAVALVLLALGLLLRERSRSRRDEGGASSPW